MTEFVALKVKTCPRCRLEWEQWCTERGNSNYEGKLQPHALIWVRIYQAALFELWGDVQFYSWTSEEAEKLPRKEIDSYTSSKKTHSAGDLSLSI